MQNKLTVKTPQNNLSAADPGNLKTNHLQNKSFPQNSGKEGPAPASQSHELGPEDGKN